MLYRQCKLRNNNRIRISWIPSPLAKLNNVLVLNINGKMEDGWLVEEMYALQTEKEVQLILENKQRHTKNLKKLRK